MVFLHLTSAMMVYQVEKPSTVMATSQAQPVDTENPSLAQDSSMLSDDELELRAQGHIGELPRRFSWFATLALAFSITNTWIGYSATFVVPLLAGAGRAVFCCLILACVACTIIATGLAELALAFPSSGVGAGVDQFSFAFMVAPEKYRSSIAFVTGWLSTLGKCRQSRISLAWRLTMLGWLFTTASTVVFCSQTAVLLASFYHEDHNYSQWQVFLIYLLITIVSCALICLLPRWVPLAEQVVLIISLVGFAVAFITVLATSKT